MTAAVATAPERRVPPLGGFSLTFLRLEIRRLLRNRRTVIFTRPGLEVRVNVRDGSCAVRELGTKLV